MLFFHAKSHPAASLKLSFLASNSKPDMVPDGHTHVQNQGLP
jgi:hypothetical protein